LHILLTSTLCKHPFNLLLFFNLCIPYGSKISSFLSTVYCTNHLIRILIWWKVTKFGKLTLRSFLVILFVRIIKSECLSLIVKLYSLVTSLFLEGPLSTLFVDSLTFTVSHLMIHLGKVAVTILLNRFYSSRTIITCHSSYTILLHRFDKTLNESLRYLFDVRSDVSRYFLILTILFSHIVFILLSLVIPVFSPPVFLFCWLSMYNVIFLRCLGILSFILSKRHRNLFFRHRIVHLSLQSILYHLIIPVLILYLLSHLSITLLGSIWLGTFKLFPTGYFLLITLYQYQFYVSFDILLYQ